MRAAVLAFVAALHTACGESVGPEQPQDPEPPPTPESVAEAPSPEVSPVADAPTPPEPSAVTVSRISADAPLNPGALVVEASAKIPQKLDDASGVHVKGACRRGDAILVDSGLAQTQPASLSALDVGDAAGVRIRLFQEIVAPVAGPCQLEFAVAGRMGGPSLALGTVCYDRGSARDGACDPPVEAAGMSGSALPLVVHELGVTRDRGNGLHTTFLLEIHRPPSLGAEVSLKGACDVGGQRLADLTQVNVAAGAFPLGAGETLVRSANLFWDPTLGLATAPSSCDLTVTLWSAPAAGGSTGQVLKRACYRGGAVTDGRCTPSGPPALAPTPPTEGSLELASPRLELDERPGVPAGGYHVSVVADISVAKPVERTQANARVACRVGSATRVETVALYGVELHLLEAVETTRMSATAFSSSRLEGKPRRCAVEFFAGGRFAIGGMRVGLGRWCLRGGKTRKC